MPRFTASLFLSLFCLCLATSRADEKAPAADVPAADRQLADYFRSQTDELANRCLADIHTLEDWESRRKEYRHQLQEMLGLDPWPARTDLESQVTGKLEGDGFTVEKVHFQSLPGLYVTGDLYLPMHLDKPAPAVLYVCGHGQVKKDGISYGNKTHYQYHGAWFARNGYVCLTIDTVQLGELEGIHHGTYHESMWWWNSRGYTPAGVEAWDGIRALDYLETRPEVDASRMGVTGRSGGGAYSWWICALDERIKAAVPVAGITDLENHVVDGCVEGHCDCMYMVNTYRWDFAQVAALMAPRPLLIANTDNDSIFPLEGVERLHQKVRRIYRLYGADDHLGLQISAGPHKDTQELQVAAFQWFNRHLKGEQNQTANQTGISYFTPEQLKVFDELPTNERNTTIHETFTLRAATERVGANPDAWHAKREGWMTVLREKCFAGWPKEASALDIQTVGHASYAGCQWTVVEFTSQEHVRLRLYLLSPSERTDLRRVRLQVLDPTAWQRLRSAMPGDLLDTLAEEGSIDADGDARGSIAPDGAAWKRLRKELESEQQTLAFLAPRGVGASAWNQSPRNLVQQRRRFMLLGQTLASMQVWDVRRALQTVRSMFTDPKLALEAQGDMGVIGLYASLFEPDVDQLWLRELPRSHRVGPDFLNVLRFLDVPQAVAMAAEQCTVHLRDVDPAAWQYPVEVARLLNLNPLQIEPAPTSADFQISEDDQEFKLITPHLEAVVRKQGYVSGVAGGSLVDRQTGLADLGYGLDIVDWIMEPGSDEAYRDQLEKELVYQFNTPFHGKTPKRSIEGPQICTQARRLDPKLIRGQDFVAFQMQYQYKTAAPGHKTGSTWNQTLVFPAGKRYFFSSDKITTVNASEAMFLRLDMPGHIKHNQGDTFSEVYLSYQGKIPASEFSTDFAPDEKFNYTRDRNPLPDRMIRGYHLRDANNAGAGLWLAGMTLDPRAVSEAWCHQRGYICMIEEFGGRPIQPGESFSAAFVVGYFDSIEEMQQVYDQYAGATGLEVTELGWKFTR